MNARHRGLRRALPTYRDLRRIVRQTQALMGALVAAAILLTVTLAVVAAAGWGAPPFQMSKLTRADMPARADLAKEANAGSGLKT